MSYYNDCGSANYQAVSNVAGFGGARSGYGMVDIVLVHNNHCIPFHFEGNFLGSALSTPLASSVRYRVRFYLSLTDNHRFASKNVGVHFSVGQPPNSTPQLLSLVPQVRYTGDFLTDKVGWMKIEGKFTAVGGENYLTIGNFDGYANSDTLNLHQGGTAPSICYWELGFYYIDDVSVTEVDTTLEYEEAEEEREPNEAVGEEQLTIKNEQLSIWPNPSNGEVYLSYQNMATKTLQWQVMDMAGRVVYVQGVQPGSGNAALGVHLIPGVYHSKLIADGSVIDSRRLVVY